jgi:hypothetical protein
LKSISERPGLWRTGQAEGYRTVEDRTGRGVQDCGGQDRQRGTGLWRTGQAEGYRTVEDRTGRGVQGVFGTHTHIYTHTHIHTNSQHAAHKTVTEQ